MRLRTPGAQAQAQAQVVGPLIIVSMLAIFGLLAWAVEWERRESED